MTGNLYFCPAFIAKEKFFKQHQILKTRLYTEFGKGIFLLIVVFFAFLPCSAKQSVLNAFDTEYSSPLNKVRTTVTQGSACTGGQEIAVYKSSASKAFFKSVSSQPFPVITIPVVINNIETKTAVGPGIIPKIPPRYILFKRLKLDVLAA